MILDYIAIRNNFINYLKSVNTTTAQYPLSSNLDLAVNSANIRPIDLRLYSPHSSEFPFIGARLSNKANESLVSNKATNASRDITFTIELTAVSEELDGSGNEDNLVNLVRNIEANVRSNITLSNYATSSTTLLYMIPTNVEFKDVSSVDFEGRDTMFNRASIINVDFRIYLK